MTPRALRTAVFALAIVLVSGTVASLSADTKPEDLAPKYREFLDDVEYLLTKQERKAFLALAKDYQRDGFIREFWRSRDPYPDTARNEFQTQWYARLEEARSRYPKGDDRARVYALQGAPASVKETQCGLLLWPIEIWRYVRTERGRGDLYLLFWQRAGGATFKLWRPGDGYQILLALYKSTEPDHDDFFEFQRRVRRYCLGDSQEVLLAVQEVRQADRLNLVDYAEGKPAGRTDDEWLQTFKAFSTDLPAGTPLLPARFELRYPGRQEGRTILEALFAVPTAEAAATDLAGQRSYNFLVSGEVLKDAELFESFRYRFDVPAGREPGPEISLPVERRLRPGTYTLVVKLEEVGSGRAFRDERTIEVPALPAEMETAAASGARSGAPGGAGSGALGAAAGSAAAPAIRILPPPGDLQRGSVRIDTQASGEGIRKVTFFLDGRPLLTKGRAPYSVELNLGDLPVPRLVEVRAYGDGDALLASDELRLNPGAQRFAVRLLSPRPGAPRSGRVTAEAEVSVPAGESLDRLELFVDDTRVATLYQAPWAQPIELPPGGAIVSVRAVAFLADGSSAEDLVVLNGPEDLQRLDVRLVELYAAVVDRDGKPVSGLPREAFTVLEDGAEQQLVRFDRVADLPIHVELLLDTSASMKESLSKVEEAALQFLQATVTPRDRAAVLRFDESATVVAEFTNDLPALAGALAGLRAERGTALWDSLVVALDHLQGIRGQRALLLLTDGGDRSSRFNFEQTLEYARRAGVTIYTSGVGISRADVQTRSRLCKLAEETGGRCVFLQTVAELAAIYDAIREDLRSQYLLAYQSTHTTADGRFREIEVQVPGEGREVKTLRGYYP